MSLQDIENSFVAAAKAEWAKIEAAGIKVEQEIVADVKTTFEALVEQFAPLVMSTISSLAVGELAKLSGSEKADLSARTVIDGAAKEGVTILAADATALVKQGFEHFKAAAPAVVPAGPVGDAVAGALDAGEAAAEGAIEKVAGEAEAKVDPPAA